MQSRQLTATSSVTSSAIAATGHGHVNATYAYGTVAGCLPSTYNVAGPITISAGTQITDYSDTDAAGHLRRIVLVANMVMNIAFILAALRGCLHVMLILAQLEISAIFLHRVVLCRF